jgi:hypothetical protein
MEPTKQDGNQTLGPVISIDESKVRAHLDRVVRDTVEETLNATLDPAAARSRYRPRNPVYADSRATPQRWPARLTV